MVLLILTRGSIMANIIMVLFFSIACNIVDAMDSTSVFFKNLTSKSIKLEQQSAKLYRLEPSAGVYYELKNTTIAPGEIARCMLSFRKENAIGTRLISIKSGFWLFSQLLSGILLKGNDLATDSSITQSAIRCGLYTDGQGDNVMLFSYSESDMYEFIGKELTDPGMGTRLFLSK
ncbi:MAG: hypothetical protein LBG48_00225 [Rickettsiales bacterium]|jgi:hypothetical protein|nr:hypothetical protein [Rickettsiales bacterium]